MDLCAAPGGWSQVVAEAGCTCVAVDLKEMAPLVGVVRVAGDVTSAATARAIVEALGGAADVVLCDGAPDVYGLGDLDSYLQNALVRAAMVVVERVLAPGGTFVSKIYRGPHARDTFDALRTQFASVVCAKPRCSRNASLEAFVVATGFRRLPNPSFVPFVACGFGDDLDADTSYPLDDRAAALDPVQEPINPTHLGALAPRIHIPDDDLDDEPPRRSGKNPRLRCAEEAKRLAELEEGRRSGDAPTVFAAPDLAAPAVDAASLAAWSPALALLLHDDSIMPG